MRLEKASSCELPVKPVLLFRHSQTATYRNMPADKTRLTDMPCYFHAGNVCDRLQESLIAWLRRAGACQPYAGHSIRLCVRRHSNPRPALRVIPN
jgi:hypothetical protein